jgi:uncharacterized membrane protein YuzA (DUF378 family)
MKKQTTLDVIATILLIIGGLNWGLIGAFDVEVIGNIFNGYNENQIAMSMITRLIYVLIGLSAVYRIFCCAKCRK